MQRRNLSLAVLGALLHLASCSAGSDSDNGRLREQRIDSAILAVPDLEDQATRDILTELETYDIGIGDEILQCTRYHRDFAGNSAEFNGLDGQGDVIYPGADVQLGTAENFVPSPVTLPRGGGRLVMVNEQNTSLPAVTLDSINIQSVAEAINAMVDQHSGQVTANLEMSISSIKDLKEIQLQLKASASYFEIFNANAAFSFDEGEEWSHFLVDLRQELYTIAFERPERPSDFYSNSVVASDFTPFMAMGNPLGYVSKVEYGRVFKLLISTKSSASEMSAALDANFFYGSVDAEGRFYNELEETTTQVFAYGGFADDVFDAISGGVPGTNAFLDTIRDSGDITAARPLSWTVRSIATDTLLSNHYAVEYDLIDCVSQGTLCRPILQSPNSGSVLDNGCRYTPVNIDWQFRWSECPDADLYHVEIHHPVLGLFRSEEQTGETYAVSIPPSDAFRTNDLLQGWRWRVRARSFDTWSPFTDWRGFQVEPIDTACPGTGVHVFKRRDYEGVNRLFNEDIADLEVFGLSDNISSIRFHNVRGVRLWDYENNGGASIEILAINGDIPHLDEAHPNWEDDAEALEILR